MDQEKASPIIAEAHTISGPSLMKRETSGLMSSFLTPLDQDTYRLLMESKQIWQRWQAAYDTGATTLDSHPALPEDANRSKELDEIIEPRIAIDPTTAIRRKGSFEADDRTKLSSHRKWRVRWLPID